MAEPAWLTKARSYIGFHEIADNRGIEEFIALARTGEIGDPWCSIFANACLEAVGIKGTRSAAANSFTQSSLFTRQQIPQIGTICTFTRPGGNHVAFYTGKDSQGRLLVLGGNQSNQVCIEPHGTDTLTGYWWPAQAVPRQLPAPTLPAVPFQPLDPRTIDTITTLAAGSDVARYSWKDRGRAPIGYTKGMAVTYGVALRRLLARDPVAIAMVRVVEDGLDVFDDYNFNTLGAPDLDRLRALWVVLLGLGMRESSGNCFEGRDMSASNTSADSAEAGLFQTSWDLYTLHKSAVPELPGLLNAYASEKWDGFKNIFQEGVRGSMTPNTGEGQGALFQLTCKNSPAFAAESAAIGLRTVRNHWGPIIRHEVEIRPEAEALFRAVESIILPLDGEIIPPAKPDDEVFIALTHVLSQEGPMDANLKAQMLAELAKPNPNMRGLLSRALDAAPTAPPVANPPIALPLGHIDLSQIGAILANPLVKKVLSGQHVTLQDILPQIPALLALLQGRTPPPQAPGTAIPDPAPVVPTPPPATVSDTAFNWSTGLGGVIAALTASGAGVIGSPIPGAEGFSIPALLTTAAPLLAGAFGLPSWIAPVVTGLFSRFKKS